MVSENQSFLDEGVIVTPQFQISEPRACDAYYRPLLSNFWKNSRSSDNKNRKDSDVDMEVEVDEVDEKR